MDTQTELLKEMIDALNEAKGLIRGWHGMGMPTDQEERMWAIYNNMSPEMKRLNVFIEKISALKAKLKDEKEQNPIYMKLKQRGLIDESHTSLFLKALDEGDKYAELWQKTAKISDRRKDDKALDFARGYVAGQDYKL